MKLGYALSSEEHNALDLVKYAQSAENAGFEFAFLSDHFHPWVSKQGHSSYAWTVLGAIAKATNNIKIGTGVTAPIIRYHPAILAQAAATTAQLFEDRFMFGIGTGENLNEHIVGLGWPVIEIRQEMLEEAVDIIRKLWLGEQVSYYGIYYTVEDAKIYTLPNTLPPILIAAGGEETGELAGKISDGLISTSTDKKLIEEFENAGGKGKPKYGQFKTVVAEDEEKALDVLWEWWPNGGIKGQLSQEIRLPTYFEQATQMLTKDDLRETSVLGKDKNEHLDKIEEFEKAGFDHVYIHQVGPDQESLFDFYESEILPEYK